MTDCCELALRNGELALRLAYGAFGTIALLLLMFFGYNLKLGVRTAKLEKKNGHELDLITQLKTKDEEKQKQIDDLKKEVERLKEKSS
jgi:hypothetical protein